MARFDSPLALLLILAVARVRAINLDDYGDLDDAGDVPQSDYSDFSSPSAPTESLFASQAWPQDGREINIARPVPGPSYSHDFDDNDEIDAPETRRKRPVAKRRSLRTKARAVTPNELYQLFGETPRRKKSAGQNSKSSLFRSFLKSALQRKHISVKKKRSIHGKKLRTKKLHEMKRSFKNGKDDDEDEADTEEQMEKESDKVKSLELVNALLSKENVFLTAALNEATVAQTNGNEEATIRKEMEHIKSAEKVEAIMRQMEQDDAAMKDAKPQHGTSDEPDDVEETVLVTDTSYADLTKCPVVKKLSTQCRGVAQKYNFNMDEDASDACDAHRICYSCSSAFSASRNLCDRLFLAQSQNLCNKEDDKQQCEVEALTLLQAIQDKHSEDAEEFGGALEQECRNPCLRAYFKGVYRSRR